MTATAEGLKEDLTKIPSWVWLGGAAAVGLLWVLHRSSASASTSTAAGTTSGTSTDTTSGAIGTPVAGSDDYGVSTALDNLSTIDQQILTYLQQGMNTQGTGVSPVSTVPVANPPASSTPATIPAGWQQVIDPNSGAPIQTTSGAPFVLPTSWPQPTASPPANVPIVQLQPIPLSQLPAWASSPTFQFTGPPAGSGYVVLPGSTAANPLIGKAS